MCHLGCLGSRAVGFHAAWKAVKASEEPPRASRLCGSETLMGPVFRRVPCYAFMLAFQVLPQSADVPKTGASATQEVASGVVH